VNPLPARYLDGATSRAVPVRVRFAPAGRLQVEGPGLALSLDLSAVAVRPRLGDTPRALDLPGGARLEVDDNDAVDAALGAAGRHRMARLVAALERHWHSVVLAVVLTLAAGAWLVAWGVPRLADHVARALPRDVERALAGGALDSMDRMLLKPSALPEPERARVAALFARVVPEGPEGPERATYRIVFRAGGDAVGANAFALPDGTVVVTDELVALARNDDEVLGVLAHEVGHVVHHHALRQALQNSMAGLLIAAAAGDVVSTTSLAAGIPVALLQTHYSRAFETEADDHAARWMRAHGIAPRHLAELLRRMEAQGGANPLPYLSTHPPTPERIARLTADPAP
jgi:Zn-dependent protease with chaperone function